jgi:peptidoglycan/LPS O-acetylase OafA/YrhL
MIVLADVARGRDNNFNLIRFIAATGVLVSHAWPISLGPGVVEPLKLATGHTLGSLAVYLFFAVSGFFIAGSYLRSNSARVFIMARVLRLFPGLAVSLLLVALVMGPLVTDLSPGAYFTHSEVMTFLVRNLTLVSPQYTLPGVFEDLPYPTVEGSIWTLIHEVLCYILVFITGVLGILQRRSWATVALVVYGLAWVTPGVLGIDLHPRIALTHGLSLPFMIGVAFRIWQDHIRLSLWVAVALMVAAGLARGTPLIFPLLALALSYATFWCAYVPGGALRGFNRLGDYSYGMYIYAFPLQGLVIWLWGSNMGPGLNIALSLPLTVFFAVLSWHLVERPALDLAKTSVIYKVIFSPLAKQPQYVTRRAQRVRP